MDRVMPASCRLTYTGQAQPGAQTQEQRWEGAAAHREQCRSRRSTR